MRQPTITMNMRGRDVTIKEAMVSAQRLINSHFNNPDSARCSIPVNVNDDDIVVMDFLTQCEIRAELGACK